MSYNVRFKSNANNLITLIYRLILKNIDRWLTAKIGFTLPFKNLRSVRFFQYLIYTLLNTFAKDELNQSKVTFIIFK